MLHTTMILRSVEPEGEKKKRKVFNVQIESQQIQSLNLFGVRKGFERILSQPIIAKREKGALLILYVFLPRGKYNS